MKVSFLFISLLTVFCVPATRADEPSNVRVRLQSDVIVAKNETIQTAVAVFGSVIVDGAVAGDAVSVFGDITIGPGGSVGGDAVAVSGQVKRSPDATVGGREVAIDSPRGSLKNLMMVLLPVLAGIAALFGAVVLIASTLGFLVLVVAILVLFERQVTAARQVFVLDPFKTFLIGFLVFLGIMPLSVFLMATIIGIPLAMIVVAVAVAAICLGSVAVCEWIGAELSRRCHRPLTTVWAGLLGTVVLFVVGLVPWVGTAAQMIVVLLGLGAVTRTRFRGTAPALEPSTVGH